MRFALRAASALVLAAAAAAALLAGSVWLFLARPQAILTARVVGTAARLFAASVNPSWSALEFSAASLGAGRHRYAARVRDLCLSRRDRGFDACFDDADVSVIVAYRRWSVSLERVERATFLGRTLALNLARSSAPPGAGGLPALPPSVRSLKWDALDVDLPRVSVADSSGTWTGRFSARAVPGRPRPLVISADFTRRTRGGARRWRLDAGVASDLLSARRPSFLDAAGSASWGPGTRAEFAARGRRDAKGELFLVFAATAAASGGRARAAGTARERDGRVSLNADFSAAFSTGPVRSAGLSACRGEARLDRATGRPEDGSVSCRYELRPAASIFRGVLAGEAAAFGTMDYSNPRATRFQARVSASAGPVRDWYEAAGRASAKVSGRVGAPWAALTVEHELDATATVPEFQRVVELLRGTTAAVPAPFHVLNGPLNLRVSARGNWRDETQTVRYVLNSDLKSRRQRLRAEAAGAVTVSDARSARRSFVHDGTLTLKDAALELPRLDVADLPKLTKDPRVKAGGKAPPGKAGPAPFPLRFRLRVRTEKPAVLFSNLARQPVPAAADVAVSSPPFGAAGTVSVKKFELELFRRTALLDHLNVTLKPGTRAADLEGLILYQAKSAVIRISVLGTTERPRIELSSAPPLRQEDIIAVLIFGKSPAELDLDQSATVGNAQTALEASAFGLASLYYFGITPIERVAYDPATKTYSVKLRLPGGVNLELGSDFDRSRGLTLRKFLAPHWAIQSEIGNQTDPAGSATTFLEWFRRY